MRWPPHLGPATCLSCVFVLLAAGLTAQQEDSSRTRRPVLKAISNNSDSLRALSFEAGPMKFVPFIAPSYTPEMQVLITAGGLITFTFNRADPGLLRSSIPFSIAKSTNGSTQLSIKANLFFDDDKFRLTGEIWQKDMPDHYYGVGYESGNTTPKSDSTTLYHRNWRRIYAKFVHQFRPKYFIGGIFDVTRTTATELNPVMLADPYIEQFGTQVNNSGLGVVMQYDSRDVPVNAYKGILLDLSVINYGEIFGGQNEFLTVDFDYRQYVSVGRRHVVAWNLRSRTNFGDVPWTDLSQIGTPFDLRGYIWGQYRDELMIYSMVEYRHMFNRRTPNKNGSMDSRLGFATWVGVGAVGPDIKALPAALPNAGIGIRLETESRSNIRVDYGIGAGSSAFYVTFYEAF